jgi:hypothetical protein
MLGTLEMPYALLAGKSSSSASKADTEITVEFPCVRGVILRDAANRERAAGMQSLQKRHRQLAHRAGHLEEDQQHTAAGRQFGEGGFPALQAREPEVRCAFTGIEKRTQPPGGHQLNFSGFANRYNKIFNT